MTEKEKACLSTALNAGSDRRGVDTTGLAHGSLAAAIENHRKHKVARPVHDENKKQQTTGISLMQGAHLSSSAYLADAKTVITRGGAKTGKRQVSHTKTKCGQLAKHIVPIAVIVFAATSAGVCVCSLLCWHPAGYNKGSANSGSKPSKCVAEVVTLSKTLSTYQSLVCLLGTH